MSADTAIRKSITVAVPQDKAFSLSWQLTDEWAYDADLWTEIEATFTAEGEGRTRVELEHRGLDAYGDQTEAMRERFDSPGAWQDLLELYAAEAAQEEAPAA